MLKHFLFHLHWKGREKQTKIFRLLIHCSHPHSSQGQARPEPGAGLGLDLLHVAGDQGLSPCVLSPRART